MLDNDKMLSNKKLHVVFTIDKNYIEQFCVACTSLIENNLDILGDIFLVHSIDNTSPDFKQLKKCTDFVLWKYGIQIKEIKLENTKVFEEFKITHHISHATYFRLMLAEILPEEIEHVLYLDVDIVVVGNLKELLSIDFTETKFYLYAVDHRCGDLSYLQGTGFEGSKYFNAGVLYINLRKWRESNITEELLKVASLHKDKIIWLDQDVLNIVFCGKWGELDYKFNAFGLETMLNRSSNYRIYKIIHYTGSSKPWHFANNHPYKFLYWKYLRQTPFKRIFYEDFSFVNLLKKIMPQGIKKKIRRIIKNTGFQKG